MLLLHIDIYSQVNIYVILESTMFQISSQLPVWYVRRWSSKLCLLRISGAEIFQQFQKSALTLSDFLKSALTLSYKCQRMQYNKNQTFQNKLVGFLFFFSTSFLNLKSLAQLTFGSWRISLGKSHGLKGFDLQILNRIKRQITKLDFQSTLSKKR